MKRRGPKPRLPRPNGSTHSHRSPIFDEQSEPSEPGDSRQPARLETAGFNFAPPTWDSEIAVNPKVSSSAPQRPIPNHASSRLPMQYQIYHDFVFSLSHTIPTLSLEHITKKCFDLYFEYLFPLIPIVHEPTLRAGLDFVLARHSQESTLPHCPWSSSLHQSPKSNSTFDATEELSYPELWPESMFTLITALCAEAASMLPVQLFPEGASVADIFLQTSRKALHEYLDADTEHPDANSVAIRYFHSNCLHASGKPKFSWHIFGEAIRLAQIMRLYDEASYAGLEAVEAQLRRRVFWILYVGDKSAALLNQRPIALHKFAFASGITVAHACETVGHTMRSTETSPAGVSAPERSIMTGFNFCVRLWQETSDLLLELRIMQDNLASRGAGNLINSEQRSHINSLYVNVMTCLDDLPTWLQIDSGAFWNAEDNGNCPKSLSIQRANLQVSFHCLRMVILQKLNSSEFSASGLGQEPSTLVLKKTEIARDMVRAIREAPFWALQVNGESCVSCFLEARPPLGLLIEKNLLMPIQVEKIRLIGASLLEVIHENENSPLVARARADFSVLLDILARLDSKASDALRSDSFCDS